MRTFNEIKSEIDLLSAEEIEEYVIKRLKELENETQELTIGQGYTDSYNGYIGLKTHYKAMASNEKIKCPDLIYDYIQPYVDLIINIKNKPINQLLVMNEIFHTINSFSDLRNSFVLSRGFTYLSAINSTGKLSIKDVFDNDCAFCSERSGLAQNMFKFLAIDSELIIGYINEEPHAYNIIYPNGYKKEPMFLFDSSHFVNFNSIDHRFSLGYFYGMNILKYNEFISGKQYKVELSKTESFYRNVFGFDETYDFVAEEPKYTFGLANNPKIVQEKINEEWLYSTHYENGVESIGYKL